MKTVFRLCNLPNLNKNSSDFCNNCIGKSHRLPSSSSLTVYDKPFDLIFTDLWGPAPFSSPLGFRYYVNFVFFFFFCSAKIDIYYYEKVPEVLEIQLLIENKHVDLVNTETQAITPMTVTCI